MEERRGKRERVMVKRVERRRVLWGRVKRGGMENERWLGLWR